MAHIHVNHGAVPLPAYYQSERIREEYRLAKLVHSLGFNNLARMRSDPGTVAAQAVFTMVGVAYKELLTQATFQETIHQTKEQWLTRNPQNGWHSPVVDTPEAAVVIAELANWGRIAEARDYSQSSEV